MFEIIDILYQNRIEVTITVRSGVKHIGTIHKTCDYYIVLRVDSDAFKLLMNADIVEIGIPFNV